MSDPITPPNGASGRTAVEVARSLAREAGELARSRFRQPQEVSVKGRGNLLSATDLEVERFLRESLEHEYPDHRLLSEETAADTATSGWVWVADPIDGTRNFVSGIPFFCVNLALCRDAIPVVAATHDPNHDESFWATSGGGAWVNDVPLRASAEVTVAGCVLGIDLGYHDERGRAMLGLVRELFPGVQSIRIPGSAALGLAYAAAGRYDLFVHHYLYPWDIAAGILLVREAGGTITRRDGDPVSLASRTVIAGSPGAHADFLRWQRDHWRDLYPSAETEAGKAKGEAL